MCQSLTTLTKVNPIKGEEIWRGAWPQRIPQCPHTSRPSQDNWSEEQPGNAGTILEHRPIIFRTRKGRKIKTTAYMQSLTGPIIESDSEEESDVAKEHKMKQLQHARAVIEANMAERLMAGLCLDPSSPTA